MRGWWRPFVGLGAVGAVAAAGLALTGRPTRDPALAILVMVLSTLPFAALFTLQARSRADHFLRGLAEGGERAIILSDEMSWMAERRVTARSQRGEWLLVSAGGRNAHLDVRAPGTRALVRVRDPREGGRQAAGATRDGTAWRPAPQPSWLARRVHVKAAFRARLAVALAAGSFAVAVALGAVLPHSPVWTLGVGLASALGWFVCVVGGWTFALRRSQAAAPLVGVSAGVAFIGLSFALAFRSAGVLALAPIAACGLGLVALVIVWAAGRLGGPLARAARGGGLLAAAAGGLLLPSFYAGLTLVVCVLALIVWVSPITRKRAMAQ